MKIFEWFEGLTKGITDSVSKIWLGIVDTFHAQAVGFLKAQVAFESIDPAMFQDKDIRAKVTQMKAEWHNSPESISDITNDVLKIVSGKVAQVQLEAISGVKLNDKDVYSNRLFTQMMIITDVTLLANFLEVVGGCIPTTNLQVLGSQLREYLSYSGLTQATGFGYGMMLSNVVSPLLTAELNQKVRPSLLDAHETIRLKYRGILTEVESKNMLDKLGLSDRLQEASIKGFEFYPTPQDFIQFAVRDTFRDDIATKYQYDSEYPIAINDYVMKAGLSPEWMKHYWRAHWQLPSPTQLYEMLHRGVITVDDARTVLKTNDYAPAFIDPMIKISYNTYTRVDIRRMYNEGVLTKEEVLKAYKEIGYDVDKAQKLTDWTTKEGLSRERDLTMSQILDAFNDGEIIYSRASEELKKLGYDEEETKIVLKLEQNKIERALKKREKAILVKKYVKGLITMPVFSTGLDGLKLSEREKNITIEEAKLQVKEL